MVVVFAGNQDMLGLSWNDLGCLPCPMCGWSCILSFHCLDIFVPFLNTLHLTQVLASVTTSNISFSSQPPALL